MKYKLTVIKYEKNENYEAEMAKFKESITSRGMYNNRYDEVANEPKLETSTRSLEVFLTDDEYKKVKAEVVKVFE